MQTPNGVVEYEGSARIDGATGHCRTGCVIFLMPPEPKPEKSSRPIIRLIIFSTMSRLTCIDMAMPVVIIPAEYLEKEVTDYRRNWMPTKHGSARIDLYPSTSG
ncbi:PrpF domain-containing protein [Shigella flexneri]